MIFALALLGLAAAVPPIGGPSIGGLPSGGLPSGGQPIGEAAYWVRAEDFPESEWHKAFITRYELMVSQAGLPIGCAVTGPSGSAIVDEIACASLVARAKYLPARDSAGIVVPQAIRGKLQWRPDFGGGGNTHSVTADLSVTTPLMTRDRGNLLVKVVLIYDQAGKIEQCSVIKGSPLPAIDSEACVAASAPGLFGPVKDEHGATTRGLREIDLDFAHGEKTQVTVL